MYMSKGSAAILTSKTYVGEFEEYIARRQLKHVNPLTTEPKVNIISSSDTCFTVTWAIM